MISRVLYTGRFDVASVDARCRQGLNPNHHLHAVPELRKRGYVVDVYGTPPGQATSGMAFQMGLFKAAQRYDAVIAHSLVEINALAALRAAGLFRTPIVAFVHSAEGRSVQRYTARGVDRVLAMNSRAMDVLEAAGIRPPRLQRFDFGAELSFYDPKDQPTEFVLSVGVSERDHACLVEASRISGIPVVIVGKLPQELQAQLPPQVQVLSQGNYDLSFERLLDLYNRARVVVVSHFGTAHPIGLNAMVEAMAMAKPIVLTRGAGIDINPEAGGFGRLVPPRDSQALASAMTDMFHAPDASLRAWSTQARAAAMGTYNSTRMADTLVAALNAL